MNEVKRSIFKQEVYLRVYEPRLTSYWDSVDLIKRYSSVFSELKLIQDIQISMPILNMHDSFYFEDLDMTVRIQSVTRTSGDNVLYLIDPLYLDDEESLSKVELLIESEEYKKHRDAYTILKKNINDYNMLPFYKRVFTKIKGEY